ncbi:MAG: tyrosine-type recombinase/integrase [Candidatus Acidiferrum sp.]
MRKPLRVRDWTRAQEIVRKWEVEGTQPKRPPRLTIEEWRDRFIEDATARKLSESTLRLYRLLFKQIVAFSSQKGHKLVSDLDLNALSEFRATWQNNALSASKKLERLRGIFKFAVKRKLVEENPALDLVSPKVKQNPTLPFTADEMEQILKAAESDEVDPRVKAFILTMRYSGLRISDTSVLAVASLHGNRLRLYMAKTGEPVSVLLPARVVESLKAVAHEHPDYFFWRGKSKISSVTGRWRAKIAKVFEVAKTENGHTHRFRDTFAVSLLENGASLEDVGTLLGHSSLRVTQKHYSPWVKTRQDALDKVVKSATEM